MNIFILFVLVFLWVLLIAISLILGVYQNPIFFINLLTSLHGVFIGTTLVFVIFSSLQNRQQNKSRILELEHLLDSQRGLRSLESANRIQRYCKELLRLGKKDLNLINLDLRFGIPQLVIRTIFGQFKVIRPCGFVVENSSFKGNTIFNWGGRTEYRDTYGFSECDFSESSLYDCKFTENFFLCKFNNARIIDCDFTEAKNLPIKTLLEAETLYRSRFPISIHEEILKVSPELILKKPIADEEINRRKIQRKMQRFY